MKRSVYAEYLDDIITVDSDAICAAMKDLFEDVRAVAEPSGAGAGGMKSIAQHNIRGERLAHILSGPTSTSRPALRVRALRAGTARSAAGGDDPGRER